jgi:hypothetical protein
VCLHRHPHEPAGISGGPERLACSQCPDCTSAPPLPASLGEQPHDPAHCDRGGQPHLGPCIAPGGRTREEALDDAGDPDVTVTGYDPKHPPVHQPRERHWSPLYWLARLVLWIRDWDLPDWVYRLRRHEHFYRLISAEPLTISGLAGAYVGGPRQTVLAWRCQSCHGPDQLLLRTVPGVWTVDKLVTPDWPALISVARVEEMGAAGAMREQHGAELAEALIFPPPPDWRFVADELVNAQRAGMGTAWAEAKRKYLSAVRVQAEADAARRTHVAAPGGF